ncbi:unnamed protein product [Phaedon cochleariae]|uniref:Cation/H+ exchanger transmembrane domain-containing protein n=1 Tax=Phaedon cochleariae TaxID=80249 RepID=A0A9P0DT70_PHACE|nr:unnamed protein product [Phaedon cochleariae]
MLNSKEDNQPTISSPNIARNSPFANQDQDQNQDGHLSRSRMISTSSYAERGPTRKKSTFHRIHEVESGHSSGRSWWFDLCIKCNSEDEAQHSWQPSFWPNFCPHPFCPSYRQVSRIVSLVLIGSFSWCILFSIIGNAAAPPNGKLFQLILLSICAHIGGWLIGLTTLPALIGMLFTGLLLQNIGVVDINESFSDINKHLSDVALVIILTRAGLDLDPKALKKLKFTVLKLGLVPWLTEAGVVVIFSKYLLGIDWKFGILLGSIIAAVAPAVVVPCLFRLRSKGYGVAKGIPTLIIAVASIDDALSVAIFGIIKGIVFSNSSITTGVLLGMVSIVAGIGSGVIWGIFCNYFPERNDPFVTPLRILLLLTGGMGAVFGSDLIGYGGAGPLACVAAAFVAITCWSRNDWDIEDNPAATAFEIFWMIFQPILFGITGARIKLHELDGNVVLLALGMLLASGLMRMLVTGVIGIGCSLNLKEKVFVSIAWMCKAIVQAALGPVALNMIKKNNDTSDTQIGQRILTTCILSIILTAPTGALLTTLLGPHLLTKTKLIPEVMMNQRKRSRKMSFRDISPLDTDEEKVEQVEKHKMSVVVEENDENLIA